MEEPSALIRWVIYLFAGGDAGRLAAIMLGVVTALFVWPGRRMRLRPLVFGLTILVGLLLYVCSPLPEPDWFLWLTAVWLGAVIWHLWTGASITAPVTSAEQTQATTQRTIWQKALLIGSVIWLLLAIGMELPFLAFRGPSHQITDVLVIGDSVTAGLNDGEDTWPQKLARETVVIVRDASQPGATLSSARKQNQLFDSRSGLVLLEIGGNDMLEGLPVRIFEQQLDQLLAEVARPGRSTVMFELPLPPFSRGYGLVQRRQARRHGVWLIPKRYFAKVLTTSGATVDGIHLSANGQARMTELIRSLFVHQLTSGAGRYERLQIKPSTVRGDRRG